MNFIANNVSPFAFDSANLFLNPYSKLTSKYDIHATTELKVNQIPYCSELRYPMVTGTSIKEIIIATPLFKKDAKIFFFAN